MAEFRVLQDGRRLLITAPGSWYWQGQLFSYRTMDGGKSFNATPEGRPEEDDTYMGYASAIGEFDGDNSDDFIVGTPKGESHHGKVDLFNQNLTKFGTLVGEQIGAYFGSSLTVADLNGDRMDDIIVGAPMYANFESSDAYDTGRVYIYYQASSRTFPARTRDILDGQSSRSRFGIALTGLGDINFDGYDDLCVGAPYAGEDKKGAVYIFHGSKKGIITEVSQVIYAKDINTPLSTFGISLSGGLDQDGNTYPDLLVGAYGSDKAVFLRTRPVVRVFASLNLQPEMINLDIKSCSLADGTRVPCLTVYTCIEYDGIAVPDELFFDIVWVLDAKDNSSGVQEQRAFYTNSINRFTESKLHKLQRVNTFCTSSYAYVKNDPGDKLNPIRVTMEFKLNTEGSSHRKQDLLPILDAYIPTITSFTAHIQKDCGVDNVCIPDLDVSSSIRVSAEHIIGSTTALEILMIVVNRGEDSFNTKLWVDLPPGVTYNTITNQRSNIAISCDTLKSDNTKVACELGNPMQKESESEFTMVFTPTNANDTKDWLVFALHANSTNPEQATNYDNNFASIEIPVIVVPEIALFGKSNPELIVLKTSEENGEDSRLVKHVFQLLNQGQSAINETELQIKLPNYDKEGKPLLVLASEPQLEGHGKCQIIIITANNSSLHTGSSNSATNAFREDSEREKRYTDTQTITCSDKYCTYIQCLVGYMAPYKSFVLTVESHLMARSFFQRREATKMYHITSIALARVKSVPYAFESVNLNKFEIKRLELVLTINTDQLKPAGKSVEMWVLAVSITAGLFVLLLLILLLWWCGFFKRKKPVEEGYFVVNGKTDIDHKIVD
ncbi:hypothetical protein BsWGS_05560 [Bradybaena similaris]